MKWSYRLARLAGIETRVHASFALLLLWVGFSAYQSTHSWLGALLGVAFITLMFGAVLLHELGHALTARRFGLDTHAITLYPIGGVAQLAGSPRNAREELWIALAGPAVNFVLAAGFGALSFFLAPTGIVGTFVTGLAWANLGLGVFNLLPAFPMDGGRVLRAALETRMGRLRATEIAAGLGKVGAIGLGIAGLMGNPWLLVIAPVLWMVGSRELAFVRARAAFEGARPAYGFGFRRPPSSASAHFNAVDDHGREYRVDVMGPQRPHARPRGAADIDPTGVDQALVAELERLLRRRAGHTH